MSNSHPAAPTILVPPIAAQAALPPALQGRGKLRGAQAPHLVANQRPTAALTTSASLPPPHPRARGRASGEPARPGVQAGPLRACHLSTTFINTNAQYSRGPATSARSGFCQPPSAANQQHPSISLTRRLTLSGKNCIIARLLRFTEMFFNLVNDFKKRC
jgi:hypothetical protein